MAVLRRAGPLRSLADTQLGFQMQPYFLVPEIVEQPRSPILALRQDGPRHRLHSGLGITKGIDEMKPRTVMSLSASLAALAASAASASTPSGNADEIPHVAASMGGNVCASSKERSDRGARLNADEMRSAVAFIFLANDDNAAPGGK